jgi:hypothetical protein
MKRASTAVFAILILTATAQATSVDVNPSSFSLNPTPGDVVNKSIEVTWNGETSTVISAGTEIIPPEGENAEGITITHFPENQGFYPGETRNFTVEVATSTALKPAEYGFETKFSTKVNDDSTSGGGSGGGSIDTSSYELVSGDKIEDLNETVENQSRKIDQLEDRNRNLSGELNQTLEQTKNLRDRLDRGNDSESNQTGGGGSTVVEREIEEVESNKYLYSTLLLAIILILYWEGIHFLKRLKEMRAEGGI